MNKTIQLKRSEAIKSPRFLICQNEMAEEGQEYIMHTKSPKMLFKVFDLTFYSIEQRELFLQEVKAYGACEVFDNTYYMIPFQIYDDIKKDFDLSGLMKRTADWFKHYLIWENEKFGK